MGSTSLTDLQTAYDISPDGRVIIDAVRGPVKFRGNAAVTEVFQVEDDLGSVRWQFENAGDLIAQSGTRRVVGGSIASDVLSLRGSTNADEGFIDADSTVRLTGNPVNNSQAALLKTVMEWTETLPATGNTVLSLLHSAPTIDVTGGTFIYSAVRDIGTYRSLVAPGFAVQTLFLGQASYQTQTALIRPNQAFVFAAQAEMANDGAGGGIPAVPNHIGMTFTPRLRATTAGDTLTVTNHTALTCSPTFSTVAGTTVSFGTVRGLQCNNPAVGLFQPGAGVESMVAYHGLDVSAIPFGGNVEKNAVRSAIAAASNAYFLRNVGTARSDFNDSNLFDCGFVQILSDTKTLSLGAAGGDVQIGWNGAALEYDPLVGDDLRWSFAAGTHTLQSANFGSGADLLMGFDRFAFGQTSAIGNQVGIFVASAQTVSLAGEWVDFLLSQTANLNLGGNAMSLIDAWRINPRGITAAGGSLTEISTLNVSTMTTSGIGTAERQALRVTGRSRLRGVPQFEPTRPAQIAANQAAYAGWGTGNSQREWAITDSDIANRQIQGISSTNAQDGDRLTFTNDGANVIDFMHQNGAAAAADRIITATGATVGVGADDSIKLRYDSAFARWRQIA